MQFPFLISELIKLTNSSTFMLPLSPSPCFRTAIVPLSTSFSPTIRRYGILFNSLSLIFLPIFSSLSSTSVQISELFRISKTFPAYSLNFSLIGRITAFSGASQSGNFPAVFSIRTAMKSFHRTEDCSMNHNRPVFLVITAVICQIKPLGHIIINLYCSKLPFSPNSIFYHEI